MTIIHSSTVTLPGTIARHRAYNHPVRHTHAVLVARDGDSERTAARTRLAEARATGDLRSEIDEMTFLTQIGIDTEVWEVFCLLSSRSQAERKLLAAERVAGVLAARLVDVTSVTHNFS